MLQSYFRSGWAFLIPYLAAYLLYAWMKWPVNPVAGGQCAVIPCLLHVYWTLHAINVVLGGIALRAWWKGSILNLQLPTSTGAHSAHLPPALRSSASSEVGSTVYRLLPWIFLSLLFYIPGVYLEFPADPWQHYARINEWSWIKIVTEHSSWVKSSTFLAYSLVGQIKPPVLQIRWLDCYYTACSLLLCWQYYRLACTVGLGKNASYVFVLIQALTLGNNLFGFYRYYGISSTIFSQLATAALTRIAIDAMREIFVSRSRLHEISGINNTVPCDPSGSDCLDRIACSVSGIVRAAPTLLALLILIIFNHVQGLGIAALGITSVVIWRLIEWRRSMIGWLILAAAAVNLAVYYWYPRHPALDAIYRPSGWMTSWYGFDLFSTNTPAFDRAAAILGLIGLFNLVVGICLLYYNDVVAWLTVLPIAALCLPCFSIPFANALASDTSLEGGYIIAFHRMLLAIPSGLALVKLYARIYQEINAKRCLKFSTLSNADGIATDTSAVQRFRTFTRYVEPLQISWSTSTVSFYVVITILLTVILIPCTSNYCNRLYNVVMVPPNDLAMHHVVDSSMAVSAAVLPTPSDSSETLVLSRIKYGNILATPGISYVLNATSGPLIIGARKWMSWPTITPPSANTNLALQNLQVIDQSLVQKAAYSPIPTLISWVSFSGYLSQHWLMNEVALEHAAQSELFHATDNPVTNRRRPEIWLEWRRPSDIKLFTADGVGQPISSTRAEDRGYLKNESANYIFRKGDLLILRPVLRALDGNGLRLTIFVKSSASFTSRGFSGQPRPLGGENWIYGDHLIKLNQSGDYTVSLVGSTYWPSENFIVRYHLKVQPD